MNPILLGIPGRPTNLNLTVLSAHCMEIVFSPPTSVNEALHVTHYTIEWDSYPNFESLLTNNTESESGSCVSKSFGHCTIADNNPTLNSFEICNLEEGRKYYVRVAARNEVSVQAIYPSGVPQDNTYWSTVVSATTNNQVPEKVTNFEVHNLGRDSLRIIFQPPKRDGGQLVQSYLLEVDVSDTFAKPEQLIIPVESVIRIEKFGRVLYDLRRESMLLSSGSYYFMRLYPINSIGKGRPVLAGPISPTSQPDKPREARLLTDTSSKVPIKNISVEWDLPSHDGGDDINGYLVEWWSNDKVPEIQVVKLQYMYTPALTSFSLSFSNSPQTKVETSMLPWNASSDLVRRELLNLGWDEYFDRLIFDDIKVTRSSLSNGLAWTISFGGDVKESTNEGNQPILFASISPNGDACQPTMTTLTIQEGSRPYGMHEIQFLQIVGTEPVTGFFRLKVSGSDYSNLLSVNSTATDIKNALELLSTVGQISVEQNDSINGEEIGTFGNIIHHYAITFLSNVGNLEGIFVDQYTVSSSTGDALVVAFDGNNHMDENGVMLTSTTVGEKPSHYSNSGILPGTSKSYTIDNLQSGREYFVSVSAKNNLHGFGDRLIPNPPSIVPPLQEPGSPNDIFLAVNEGRDDRLTISYRSPHSDGGDPITKYRIELDPSPLFDNPIVEYFRCPSINKRTIWEVKSGIEDGYIYGGSFTLKISFNGISQVSRKIPYNAVALKTDEIGKVEEIIGPFIAFNNSNIITHSSGKDIEKILFKGDRLKFSDQLPRGKMYTVTSVNNSSLVLNEAFEGLSGIQTSTHRVYGGRGNPLSSQVHCHFDQVLCPHEVELKSGSLQSKLEDLSRIIINGVLVEREGPDDNNGFTWRITFLDDSPILTANDFKIVVDNVSLNSANSSNVPFVSASIITYGKTYNSCVGEKAVPSFGGLTKGLTYYGRVSAVNTIGYSFPNVALKPQAPIIVPGLPTGVTLDVISASELRVMFGAPSDDGGDEVQEYLIEWDSDRNFQSPNSDFISYLAGGSPFTKVISHLSIGVYYYVRVSAKNSQGFGPTQSSTPLSANPHEKPGKPIHVKLGVTTKSMLTAGWDAPLNDGGDDVTLYRLEWDISADFNSKVPPPHKGFIDIDALYHSSYTIDLLSEENSYYVRVSAMNSAGRGSFQSSSPLSASPSNQVPGVPSFFSAQTGDFAGEITLSWQHPKVPHHGIPCYGFNNAPLDCPGHSGQFESNGGDDIVEYEIEYNENDDFNGNDGGRIIVSGMHTILTGLIEGRQYYVRILARNSIGSGQFSNHVIAVAKQI